MLYFFILKHSNHMFKPINRKIITILLIKNWLIWTYVKLTFSFHYRYSSVDINVAVATDQGLITPIVFRADVKVSISTS